MAKRTIYIPKLDELGVIEKTVDFDWSPGFSVSQKQKSIASLHKAGNQLGIEPILEISSKSTQEIGVKTSAFNLSFETKKSSKVVSVESAFQGSKRFQFSGPFIDLYDMSARDAKKEVRERQNGKLTKFIFFGKEFPLQPTTYFYDWLYIKTLCLHENLSSEIENYRGFTDIEFNPQRSVNCQAYSAALYVSLVKTGLLQDALESETDFLEVLSESYRKREKTMSFQAQML